MPGQYVGKACPKCGNKKRFKSNRGCVDCGLAGLRAIRDSRVEEFKASDVKRMRAKRKNSPEEVKLSNRRYVLRVFYNITPEDFEKIRRYQSEHPVLRTLLNKPSSTKAESVEHRHKDGLIRGVMHGLTNKAYGSLEAIHGSDTPQVLRAMAEFHENPPAVAALGEAVYGLMGKAKHKKEMKYGPDGRKTPLPRQSS